jgi:hypothetical protein
MPKKRFYEIKLYFNSEYAPKPKITSERNRFHVIENIRNQLEIGLYR